ncbi:MAG: helix-turn-helix transcriptional regulator [Lachnospiraceae bacterium]|nr:helix-turn-helix transcriptional regulator [Lachnospiraceae bacterium]
MPNFSERLKDLKNERNLFQKDIANAIGISLRAYQYYEAGERKPDIEILEKLADYFEISTDFLLGRTDNPNIN